MANSNSSNSGNNNTRTSAGNNRNNSNNNTFYDSDNNENDYNNSTTGAYGMGPILSILDLSRSRAGSGLSNDHSPGGQLSNLVVQVLPTDCDEENSLQRIRYKLENLYPTQKDYAITQLLDKVKRVVFVSCALFSTSTLMCFVSIVAYVCVFA